MPMAPRSPIAAALVLALAGTLPAADPKHDEAVKRAIRGGQLYLKAVFKPGGPGPGGFGPGGLVPPGLMDPLQGGGNGGGSVALAGLALIESGVPANDPVVAAMARATRESSLSVTGTYTLSLYIMFLDRVGSKYDQPLIQFLTLRLLSGQCADGSWSYQCNGLALDPVQQRSLYADLTRGAKMATPEPAPKKKEARPRTDLDDGPKPPKKDDPPPAKEKEPEKPAGLHPSLEKYAGYLKELPAGAGAGGLGYGRAGSGDHSNTQFATVALWCGRRHHVNVSDALYRLDKHYRQGQAADGGWGYTSSGDASTPSMTCAGLMGLAMGFGTKELKDGSDKSARIDADAVSKDRVVQGALKYVGDFLAAAAGQREPRDGTEFQVNELSRNLYFLWSLERVGMAYGLTTIGKVDWYDWGSRLLVRTQGPDGSWSSDGIHSGSTDNATAFALLFLCRANLAQDLTSSMTGKVKDPGTARLRSPGDLKDAGKGSASTTSDPAKLADALVAATGARREELLAKYRDSKGAEYTQALVLAVRKLTGEALAQARAALAERSVRFTADTLNQMMRDPDPEVRRAAALAAGAKGRDRLGEFAASLVGLTADKESLVVQAARASLKALTGEDHGPEPGANDADRTAAITAWRNWLAKQPK